MFTGLIAETGTIESVTNRGSGTTRIRIAAPALAARLHTGDSIAVSGVCLTALEITATAFSADLLAETIRRTSLSRLRPGAPVNLELPTPAGTPLGGHVVQGHVDNVGELLSLQAVQPAFPETTDWTLRLRAPANVARYVVEKGSIAIEGISLTVATVEPEEGGSALVTVALIPHTYAATNLHALKPGDPLNLEADVLAKYAEQHRAQAAGTQAESMTEFSLIAQGY